MAYEGDILAGGLQGAAAGAAFGAPGAIVGAALGVVGGIFGGKAKKKARQAAKISRRMAELAAAVQRRDLVRQFRIARARAVALGTAENAQGAESSAAVGALGSLGSQFGGNLEYFDAQAGLGQERNRLLGKADQYAGNAGLIFSLLETGAKVQQSGLLELFKPSSTPSTTTSTTGTVTGGIRTAGLPSSY